MTAREGGDERYNFRNFVHARAHFGNLPESEGLTAPSTTSGGTSGPILTCPGGIGPWGAPSTTTESGGNFVVSIPVYFPPGGKTGRSPIGPGFPGSIAFDIV